MGNRGLALTSTSTVLATLLVAGAAGAQPKPDGKPAPKAEAARFEDLAAGATRVDREGLAGLAWALTAACDRPEIGDELARRQCRAIQTARARGIDGRTFVVPADAAAFVVGAWDAKKQALPLTLSGCVACVDPIVLDGTPIYVISDAAAPAFDGAVARAAVIHETARPFGTEEEAIRWRTEVVPRLRTELVVTLDRAGVWETAGKRGLAVKVVGFRVSDPCDGGVVCASPKSGQAPVDATACGGNVVEGKPAPDAAKQAPAEPTIPEELDADMIKKAMAPVRAAADQCLATYGVPGDAKLRVTVAADGAVVAVEQSGDFADTPTGTCIDKAVKAVTFPRTKKSRQSFSYPIILR